MKKHYVYRLTDKVTNEYYYGVRTCYCPIEEDTYMGSMKVWKPNYDNLIKEIVCEFDNRKDATNFEAELIIKNMKNPLNRNYGWHIWGEMGFYGKKHDDETKQKISKAMNKYDRSGENNPFYGKKHTPETLKKMTNSLTGHTHSDKTKKKMSESASKIDRSEYKLKRKKVLHLESGRVYQSIYMAAKELGMSRTTVRKYMDDKFKLV